MQDTQRIYALISATSDESSSHWSRLMQLEAAHVWSLYERGTVREFWERTDAPGAVYVLESSPEGAAELMAAQPLVRAGLARADLAPVAAYRCLVDLFGTQPRPIEAASIGRVHEPWARTQPVLAVDRFADGVDDRDLEALAADEARQVWALRKAGLIREAHRRTDGPGMVALLEVADEREARALTDDLPLVRAGLASFDLFPVGVFSGLDALLDNTLD